ncbi:hypothetical protein PTTG_31071, partial [Puccinia triticina 1-1 BBBD Race 1]
PGSPGRMQYACIPADSAGARRPSSPHGMAVASASWTTHNNMSIKLSDLPLDVVRIIIAHCMDHRRPSPKCH